jgi:type I restriction enzyme M protein
MEGFNNPYDDEMTLTELKKTEEYKAWKAEIDAEYREKINELKEKLEDLYLQNKQNELPDYPIFMAIAEDIGYDATGKQTQVNELELISTELAEFIQEIENENI